MSYGSDIWCTDGLQTGRLARGRAAVVQALYRRLITPRGTLRGGPAESNYGLDLASYIGATGDAAVRALPGLVRGELSKDERVADVAVSATAAKATDGTIAITLDITVALQDESAPFTFSVLASAVGVTLIGGAA